MGVLTTRLASVGLPPSRSVELRRDKRRSWVVVGSLLVTLLAVALYLLGAARAEVVATLLFAVVLGVTLMTNRTAGMVSALASAAIYAWLRRDALDDVGAARLGVVVAGRAVAYLALAYTADLMRDRLPRLPVVKLAIPHTGEHQLSGLSSSRGGRSRRAAPVDPQPEPVGVDEGAYVSEGAYAQDGVYADEGAYAAPDQAGGWREPLPHRAGPNGNGGYARPAAADAGWAGGDQFAGGGRESAMPTGWMQGEDPGDEIPVGYTGELFLPDLSDQPEPEVPGNGAGPPAMHSYEPVQPVPPPEPYGGERPYAETYEAYEDDGYAGEPYADDPYAEQAPPGYGADPAQAEQQYWDVPAAGGAPPGGGGYGAPQGGAAGPGGAGLEIDPETRLWTASYFRDRLTSERESSQYTGAPFSVVMLQVPDAPLQSLPQRRQVALLRELGHQFIQAQMMDHLVHLPDQGCHWFAVVLAGTDRSAAHSFERRLRAGIAGYLRNRGLNLSDVQSATLTSPDDDEMMTTLWSSLLGQQAADGSAAWSNNGTW